MPYSQAIILTNPPHPIAHPYIAVAFGAFLFCYVTYLIFLVLDILYPPLFNDDTD